MSAGKWMGVLKQRQADLPKTTVTCQRCLEKGHWTYECKNPQKYVKRTSRTTELKRKMKRISKQKDCSQVKAKKICKKSSSISSSDSSNSSSDSSDSSSDSSDSSSDSDSSSSSSSNSSTDSDSSSSDDNASK